MSKKLVAYFSATGRTAKVAKLLAEAIGADIHEIKPKEPYTRADLNWMNRKSRSSIEMNNKAFRPEIVESNLNIGDYDVVFLGFPMWRRRLSTPSWRVLISPERKSFSSPPLAAVSSEKLSRN